MRTDVIQIFKFDFSFWTEMRTIQMRWKTAKPEVHCIWL